MLTVVLSFKILGLEMTKKRFSADQWREWFLEFEQCGLTVQQFCDSKETTANTFYKWRRKLKEQPESTFVPLVMPEAHVEFEFPGGVVGRVRNDAESLRPILSLLLERATQ